MKTTYTPKKSEITRKWYILDAQDKILGKISALSAAVLRGKHKPIFSPHLDCGDHIVIINADKLKVTGNKMEQKIYYKHTGYPGALKEISLEKQMNKDSTKVIYTAIAGMIPRNRLKNHVLNKLKIYKDENHPHEAQQPEILEV